MKAIEKRSSKQKRELEVLLGLVDYYLKTGKPVGSNTLKDAGFENLSSATIRNYFASLEEAGYLIQQHTSGGRVPTHKAYRFYAQHSYVIPNLNESEVQILQNIRQTETREIAAFLQRTAETLSSVTTLAVFLSAPRFDHDYIVDLKIVPVDHQRCLCVLISDFGVVKTELLNTETKLSAFAAKRIEAYCHWRLTGHDQPEPLEGHEEELAQKIYNEIMIRYIINYSNFIETELYRTGFSKLLIYPEFHDPTAFAESLSLFENLHSMRLLVKECLKGNHLKFWIGDDLGNYTAGVPECSILAIPYSINQNPAGVIGLVGPTRINYHQLFALLQGFAQSIGEALTRNLYKFKITFRQPHLQPLALQKQERLLLEVK